MGKKKAKQKEPDFWEIDWNRVKSWDELMDSIHKLGDILKSPVGNRDEDICDDPNNATGSVPNTDGSDTSSEQTL